MLMMRPPFPLTHGREDGAHAQENTGNIDVHHPFPLVDGNLPEPSFVQARKDRSIIDQNVNAIEPCNHVSCHRFHRPLVADIDCHSDSFATRYFDLALNAVRVGTINVGNHDRGARRRKLPGELATNALPGSGYDRDPFSDAEIARVLGNARILGYVDRGGINHTESTRFMSARLKLVRSRLRSCRERQAED
jgi:hypothetical protein